ncbi:MAG: S24/S26 family peptidase [Methanobacterium sp.]
MKSRTGILIAIIVIGIIAATLIFMQGFNTINITVNTNGSNVDVKPTSLFYSPPPQMTVEMEQSAMDELIQPNSTVDSIKSEMKAIAKKYNYVATVTVVSPYGTDQLPMPAKVSGTSMVPTLKDGQQIIVLKTKDYKVDDIVVAIHPDYGLIVKRLKQIEPDRVYLMSDNRNVEYFTIQKNLGNGLVEVDTYKKTPLDTWLPRENLVGVVKVY